MLRLRSLAFVAALLALAQTRVTRTLTTQERTEFGVG